MSSRQRICLPIIALFLFLSQLLAGEKSFRVVEAEMRAEILEKEIRLTAPVLNSAGISVAAALQIEILDESDRILATSKSEAKLKPGRTAIKVNIPRTDKGYSDAQLWHRIRYRLIKGDKSLANGLVALGALTSDFFDLRIAHAKKAISGKPYRVRVHTDNTVTHKPMSGVQVSGELAVDYSDDPVVVKRTTNVSGDAVLVFQIPKEVDLDDYGKVKIIASKGSQTHTDDFDFDFESASKIQIIINTDKLLYQPGQSLHARALILGEDKHAVANEAVDFKLVDSSDDAILDASGNTNEFGIVNVDWDLADSVKLGPYELKVSLPDKHDGDVAEKTNVRISRYDLPNFIVIAKPNRSYYLPDQNASVEISAKYLFGKELSSGTVRLVRLDEGRWNDDKQKTDFDETEEHSGSLDSKGRTVFSLDLAESHSKLEEEQYQVFRDLNYAAYVTDPTSGKTEQRRFAVRISRAPVHIYISGSSLIENRASFFISTYYPDGKPAECQISISEDRNADGQTKNGHGAASRQVLRKIRTSKHGVAKISDLPLLNLDGDHRLVFDAHDNNGVHTSMEESFWKERTVPIQVTTDKSLYKQGDLIALSVRSPRISAGNLMVDISHDNNLVWTGKIRVRNYKGSAFIPYLPDFKGELLISIYFLDDSEESYDQVPYGSRKVLFPNPAKLTAKISSSRNTYKPGEEAMAQIDVTTGSGSPVASALGAVIIDKAVDERMRADVEFGSGHYGFWDWSWLYSVGTVGGFTRKDLDEIDMTQPLPEDMNLIAEMLLQIDDRQADFIAPEIERYNFESNYDPGIRSSFGKKMQDRFEPVQKALLDENAKDWKFATNTKELAAVIQRAGIKIDDLVDPWDTPYRFTFGIESRHRTIEIRAAGPDKQFDTSDDFTLNRLQWEYFARFGKIIDAAIRQSCSPAGCLHDPGALNNALVSQGLDLTVLRDPWGSPYQLTFNLDGPAYQLSVLSPAPADLSHQPFIVWTCSIDYFDHTRKMIEAALQKYFQSTGIFPRDDASFEKTLAGSDIKFHTFVDPLGHPYFVRYSFFTRNIPDANTRTGRIRILSSGPDGKPDTDDDVLLANFTQLIGSDNMKTPVIRSVAPVPLKGYYGAIRGVVRDPTDAVLPGSTIAAKLYPTGEKFSTTSGDDGIYVLRNIPPGIYDVCFSLSGFNTTCYREVGIHSASMITIDVKLWLAMLEQQIEVSAKAENYLLESSSSTGAIVADQAGGIQIHEAAFTPRLRDYFPETLFWAPSVITDSSGHARLKFKLADSITTWKMMVLASTKTGEIAVAEKEFEAFQPFFIDHEPPKVLTVGDQIDLPVIVRNYYSKPQEFNIEMKPAPWFQLQEKGPQHITIAGGESKPVLFPFAATAMAASGKQQVYAANRATGDAIEKPVRVHPDGLERNSSASGLLGNDERLQLAVSGSIVPGSLKAQLKVYSKPLAHVTESLEAGLQRPHGCGEQTTSSTYPSVLLLKYYKASGKTNGPLQEKAKAYLKIGYKRLLSFRKTGGGFGYYPNTSADIALTAYILRFLRDASEFAEVDPKIVKDAEDWLISIQASDGSWTGNTGYVAATISQTQNRKQDHSLQDSLSRALAYLSKDPQLRDEPYNLAEFALADMASGDSRRASETIDALAKLAIPDRDGYYWPLKDSTPFNGWGRVGGIESTAMAVLALSGSNAVTPEIRGLIRGGTLWLLRQQDQYGVWHSGQATVAALSAILSGVDSAETALSASGLRITVNGNPVEISQTSLQSDAPAVLDISDFIKPGDNSIQVVNKGSLPAASVQAVADYYIPWAKADNLIHSQDLQLDVKFDRIEAKTGEQIQCTVEAARKGNRGQGMMIAEIGLPPGSAVDQTTLDKAIENSHEKISRYDVLPDRLILYLWPRDGKANLTFAFKPRYGLKARTAPSTLYDYYNPDAQVTLPPVDFIIQRAN
jgi:uncharacterized protein YfaS (alpha-2-macroglobulin family)